MTITKKKLDLQRRIYFPLRELKRGFEADSLNEDKKLKIQTKPISCLTWITFEIWASKRRKM